MTPEEVRRQTIIALFSDDYLLERLVLKGGNALHLAHRLAARSSLDLDFSMAGDFEDFDEAAFHLSTALRRHFSGIGLVVFGETLVRKPRIRGVDELPWWGGYELTFKLIDRKNYIADQPERMSREAIPIGPRLERKFSVEVSKHEYTAAKIDLDFEDYTLPVYTLEMIAGEKLRAICQQMPEYAIKGPGTQRARDFYDIHLIVTERDIDLSTPGNQALLRHIFVAKNVPLHFLGKIPQYREFHRGDWPAVINAVSGNLEGYDFYFDFVLALVARLEPLWIEDPPA